MSNIMALRNEKQPQVNIYIYKLHIYYTEWEGLSFIYKEQDYERKKKVTQCWALHMYMVYSNLEKRLWSGAAWDCWYELPSGVTTTGRMKTSGQKHLDH